MAILVNSQENMTGIAHAACGAIKADDVSADLDAVIVITLGFAPKHVRVINVADKIIHEWHYGMDVGDYIEEVAAGDKTTETDDLLSVDVDAGTISITQASNPTVTDGDLLVWEARG